MTDSIRYAMTMQQALLPEQKILNEYFSDSFIFYKPKDIVSGDFYWWKKRGDEMLVICSDCTGHGVPGAFMSLIGIMLIEEAIEKHGFRDTDKIFKEINAGISRILKQEDKNNNDGMEAAICHFEKDQQNQTYHITFTGAKRPFYLVDRKGQLQEFKPDRKSIGGYRQQNSSFTKQTIEAEEGSMVFLTSDGYQDQNNPKNLKFGIRTLREMLTENALMPLQEQSQVIDQRLKDWMQNKPQRDDITILGIRL
jgi:serine phosphatase RsbU (regulator of sigma subunit)